MDYTVIIMILTRNCNSSSSKKTENRDCPQQWSRSPCLNLFPIAQVIIVIIMTHLSNEQRLVIFNIRQQMKQLSELQTFQYGNTDYYLGKLNSAE